METTEYEVGSVWRKWDLHVHSPLSILNNRFPKLEDGVPDWESYIQRIESLGEIGVIGITDYFTIDGYKFLKGMKEIGRLKNVETIIPNIEFRLNTFISRRGSKSDKRLNFHVLFSEDVSVTDIEEHFLYDLNLFYKGNPQNPDYKRKLKVSNLQLLGTELLGQDQSLGASGKSPLQVGAEQAVVNHEEITEVLTRDNRFVGKYLIVLPAEGWDEIPWGGQDHLTRQNLLQKSDMVFSSNPNTVQWCLGKPPYNEGAEKFVQEFGSLKACIHGSDAHKLDEIGNPCILRSRPNHDCSTDPDTCENRFCWIKADPTFEGLKQLLYEPEERVKIQEHNPEPLLSNFTINKFSIDNSTLSPDLAINSTSLRFNSGLVAIVGGRGAGKTAFVDLLANCYMNRSSSHDRNSFVNRIMDLSPAFNTSIELKDGTSFIKSVLDDKFLSNDHISYISQGELEDYIGEEDKLNEHIMKLVFNNPSIKNSKLSYEFDNYKKTYQSLVRSLNNKLITIEKYEAETSDDIYNGLKREKEKITNNIKDISLRITKFEGKQTDENLRLAREGQEKLGSYKLQHDRLLRTKEVVLKLLSILDSDIVEFNQLISDLNILLPTINVDDEFPKITYAYRERLEKLLELIDENRFKAITAIEIEKAYLANLEASVKENASLIEHKQDLESQQLKIDERIIAFDAKKRDLKEEYKRRDDLLNNIFQNILSQRENYQTVLDTFSSGKAKILSDIDFSAEIKFDEELFVDRATSILDNRKVNVQGDRNNESDLRSLIDEYNIFISNDNQHTIDLVNETAKYSKSLADKIKSYPITTGKLYEFIYGEYLFVFPKLKYKGTNLDKLSLGQKATVLLKIHLAYGEKPVIIDSHDDHLDNEFIMSELVDSIRNAKHSRQIILVSNNGNVVINSDAEQLVIASRDNTNISYSAGSIENPAIREKALNVLEGGREAFQKRQKKYRIEH